MKFFFTGVSDSGKDKEDIRGEEIPSSTVGGSLGSGAGGKGGKRSRR